MEPFRLTLKNYRCFSDDAPAEIEVGPGMTAFVGPNNSGKSTLLKAFYELKHLFNSIGSVESVRGTMQVGWRPTQLAGTSDPFELFYNGNRRGLSVGLEFPEAGEDEIFSITFEADREHNNAFKTDFRTLRGERVTGIIPATSNSDPRVRTEGGRDIEINRERHARFSQWIARTLYIPPYRSAIGQTSGNYYDLQIGSLFVTQFNAWKTGDRQQSQTVIDITNDIARMFGYERLEITPAGTESLAFNVDGRPYYLRELGTGLSQFVVALGNVAMKQPSCVLIDEPEAHLHPALQSDFLLALGARAEGNVMFATHSVGLARTMATRIYSLTRSDKRSIIRPFEGMRNLIEFLGEMSFSTFKEIGCGTVLLVEGVNDVKAVKILLRAYGRDHDVVVLPMGGDQFFSSSRDNELAEVARIAPNVAVLVDSERAHDGAEIAEPRRSFIERCKDLGFHVCATYRRAFENYLTTDALRFALGRPTIEALGPHEALRSRRGEAAWSKIQNWQVAQHMTGSDLNGTDLGQFLSALPHSDRL
jgi:predicted ATPase